MNTMLSKFRGTCRKCGGSIARGETIAWSREAGACHPNCAGVFLPTSPQDVRAACWDCKAPDGRFRNFGAATPVYCDNCHARYESKRRAYVPDFTDLAYEDQCAAACGL